MNNPSTLFGSQNDKPIRMPQHRVRVLDAGFLIAGKPAVVNDLIMVDSDVARDLVSRKLAEPSP